MCDQDALDDMLAYPLRGPGLSRRELGTIALGTGLALALPKLGSAAEVTESEVEIKTPDGTADSYFVHPTQGKAPAVLVWPDIFGLRPTFRQMGKRLAESGYAVLVINPI
jgi:carboxymethylenebutenolidase